MGIALLENGVGEEEQGEEARDSTSGHLHPPGQSLCLCLPQEFPAICDPEVEPLHSRSHAELIFQFHQ